VGVLIHLISCRGQGAVPRMNSGACTPRKCLSVCDRHPCRWIMVMNLGNLWQEAGGFVVLDPKEPNSIGGDTKWGEPSPIKKK
jgi:hypothetical protein